MAFTCNLEGSTVRARSGDREIGHISVPRIEFHWADGVYVDMAGIGGVGTDEAFRNRGVAGAMMESAKRFARASGCAVSGLSTNLGNNARRLYARAGYTLLFRPGRFEKELAPAPATVPETLSLRPFRPGDETALIDLFETLYRPYFGTRKKNPGRWRALRGKILERDPDAIAVAETDGVVLGWSGYFEQWVGTVSELCVRPSEAREAVAQVLLDRLETHLLALGHARAHVWASPQDRFLAGFLARNGYAFSEQRVFMVAVLHLPGLLAELLPLLNARLPEPSPWTGVLRLSTPHQHAHLRIGDRVALAPGADPDADLVTSRETLVQVLSGTRSPWEAYLDAHLSVKPRLTPELRALLASLFPRVPAFHPAEDLW